MFFLLNQTRASPSKEKSPVLVLSTESTIFLDNAKIKRKSVLGNRVLSIKWYITNSYFIFFGILYINMVKAS